jgi:GMP reductase
MKIEDGIKLDFCDVLIRPKRSETASRSNVVIKRTYQYKNSKNWYDGFPIFAANMDTVGTMDMAREFAKHGMDVCLHKHYKTSELIDFFKNESDEVINHAWYTLGIVDSDMAKFERVFFQGTGCGERLQHVCIDVANGYSAAFVDKVKRFREQYPAIDLMVGNVCTPEMVQELLFAGADIVKVGIGPGSVCETRIVAGVGYPQLSAIIECADAAHGLGGLVCADGGCTTSGDIAKAFGAGADFAMLGGMLSGTEECEGEWEYSDAGPDIKEALIFYGMSSETAMDKYSGGMASHRAAEGKVVKIPYKGPVQNVIQNIEGGIRSACSYVGATRLKDLSKCTTFVRCARTHNTVYGE